MTTVKYEETTRFREAGAIVIRIVVLSLLAMLGVMFGIVDGVVVYSLIMNSPDRGWILPASIFLLAVIVGPTLVGTWLRKARHLGRSTSLQITIVILFVGSVTAACILVPAFSM